MVSLAGIGLSGALSAIFILIILSQISLIPIEFSLIGLSIIELRENPDEPKGLSLSLSDVRIHHYIIGIFIVISALIIIKIKKPKPIKKSLQIGIFLLGFGGFLIIDQLPNIITGIWDRPIF